MKIRNILLFILFTGLFNFDIGNIQILYWGMTLGCSVLLIISNNPGLTLKLNVFWKGQLFFFLICIVSFMWSIDRNASVDYLKTIIVNLFVLFAVYSLIHVEQDLQDILLVMMISIFGSALYLLAKVDWSTIGVDRLGVDYTGKVWNANALGLSMLWGIAIALILIDKKKRVLKMVFTIPMLIILVYSGSRKAWIGFAVVIVLILFLQNKTKILRNILIISLVSVGLYYLLMNVDFFYELGGQRLEQLILGLLGKGEVDHSTYLRQEYIRLGLEWFRDNPILGYGINSYRRLLLESSFRTYTYAHNNYVELLVDVGIVGTAIFYYMYVWSITKGIYINIINRKKQNEKVKFILFLLCLALIQLLMHVGMIAYTDLSSLIIIMIFCSALDMYDKSALKRRIN